MPSPWQVLGPSTAAVLLLLLVAALVVRPDGLVLRVSADDRESVVAPLDGPGTGAAASEGRPAPGQAAPPREDLQAPPPDRAEAVAAALGELLRQRDGAVLSGDGAVWTAVSADPTDTDLPDGSFTVLMSLPVTRFESSVVPGTVQAVQDGAGGGWQARVETRYGVAGAEDVVRSDSVRLARPREDAGWRVVSWAAYPEVGDAGTTAPWDLGEVHATVGNRGVVLSWVDRGAADGSRSVGQLEGAQAWGGQVSGWVEHGAVVVDSYLGTGWPRTTLLLAPATTAQYDALVPGPAPTAPDVFAAVTTDVETPDGVGDLVVLNPTAREELVAQTWQVTMTHELVHVASGARYGDGQEIWLAEGLADLVGWSDVVPGTAGRERVAARLLERVRAGTAEADLPDADDFSSADPDVVGDAYEGAWLAALLLQDELGLEGLLGLYEAASEGPGSPAERLDGALVAATGEGRAAFETRWRAYLSDLATA